MLDVLLKETRRSTLGLADRIIFWKLYSNVLQKELNGMKSRAVKRVKDIMTQGIVICFDEIYYYFFLIFTNLNTVVWQKV